LSRRRDARAGVSASCRLAHVSDLHVAAAGALRARHLVGKRVLGALNLALGRKGAHATRPIELLGEDLRAQAVDHVVVSGDLSNLAFVEEFEAARRLVEPLGGPERLSLVPGNHDRYTHDAARERLFERVFAPWLCSDLEGVGVGGPGPRPYPWVKLLGATALIGLDSAVATPWFFSGGRLGEDQRAALEQLLARPEVAQRRKVVVLHHPSTPPPGEWLHAPRSLFDRAAFNELLGRSTVDLVLTGHDHHPRHETLARRDGGAVALHTATSLSLVQASPARRARYAIYDIPAAGPWTATWRVWDPARGGWGEGPP